MEEELSLEDLRSLRGESIKFPLLADKTGAVGRAMGVFDEGSGMHRQSLVVLGKGLVSFPVLPSIIQFKFFSHTFISYTTYLKNQF